VDGTDISVYTDSVTHNRMVDTAETTAFSNNDKTFIAGLMDGSFDLSGHWDATADAALHGCFDGATVAVIYGPAGSTSGLVRYTANCLITNYAITSQVADRVNWTVSLQRTGALTRNTF
jgi:hypothetical protein